MRNATTPEIGMEVVANGFAGVVTGIYDKGINEGREWFMVNVRLQRGEVCVSWNAVDCYPA